MLIHLLILIVGVNMSSLPNLDKRMDHYEFRSSLYVLIITVFEKYRDPGTGLQRETSRNIFFNSRIRIGLSEKAKP